MKLKNIIEEFLKAQNDETRSTYKKKIYVFGEYLVLYPVSNNTLQY